jgi:hypothetical protein
MGKWATKSEFYWTFFAKQAKLSTSIRQYSVYGAMALSRHVDGTSIKLFLKNA